VISFWTDATGNINQIKTISTPPTHVCSFSILEVGAPKNNNFQKNGPVKKKIGILFFLFSNRNIERREIGKKESRIRCLKESRTATFVSLYLGSKKVRKYFFQLLMLLIQLKVFWNIWFLSWQKNSEAKEKTPHCFNMTIHSMLKVLLKCNFEVIF